MRERLPVSREQAFDPKAALAAVAVTAILALSQLSSDSQGISASVAQAKNNPVEQIENNILNLYKNLNIFPKN